MDFSVDSFVLASVDAAVLAANSEASFSSAAVELATLVDCAFASSSLAERDNASKLSETLALVDKLALVDAAVLAAAASFKDVLADAERLSASTMLVLADKLAS